MCTYCNVLCEPVELKNSVRCGSTNSGSFFICSAFYDHKKNLRNLKGIKAFVVSLTWSVSTVLLPLLNNDVPITSEVLVDLVQRFLFILALMIPFEIRDLKFDEPNLRTLPQVLGVAGSRWLGVLLLVFFVIFGLLKTSLNTTSTSIYVEWGV